MGGSARIRSYDDAREALSSTRSSADAFAHSERMARSRVGTVHDNLNPKGKVRECLDTSAMPKVTPIAMAMDVTRSRGQDAKTVYSTLMPFMGSLYLSGAVVDPQIMFMAFGDATTDRAPLQVGQFESDERMDADLERMWLEEGGGGTGEESAELAAYFLARHTKIDAVDKRSERGYAFFLSDEAPYPVVCREQVERIVGDRLRTDIPTKDIFDELQVRFRTYLIYPGKPLAARQADIDAEIRQRLLKAGGRFENCSIRASLIWQTRDDLDLHMVTPVGEEICFHNKQSSCGGELDVDRNVRGETREPVENIRWAKGTAQPGKYTVYVQNYAYHDREFHGGGHKKVPFKVELDIDGTIQAFEGEMVPHKTGAASNVTAFEFTYAPEQAGAATSESREVYTDEAILGKWRGYIPDAHIIRLTDARWATEAILGVMSIQSGRRTLADVIANMHERAISPEGIADVQAALAPFAAQAVVTEVSESAFS